MKYGYWTILVAVMTFAIFALADIPFWLIMAIIIPLLVILLIYGSFLYSFRESLAMEAVPKTGYSTRINELDRESALILPLGFRKIDMFYLRAIPDSVSYIYKHEQAPVYFCQYHFGKKHACDLVTRYERGFYLTTSNTIDSGMTPRPKKALLQIFPGRSYEQLMGEHLRAHEHIRRNGVGTYDISENEFRFTFMKNLHEQADHIRKYPFWPVQLLVRTVLQAGKKYCRSIPDQYPDGFADLMLETARGT